MRGLLIEDDTAKANKIAELIAEHFPQIQLNQAISYQSGINEILEYEYDFILLDMSLPTYDQINGNFSGKPKGFGGEAILKEMRRYKRNSIVKVITQYNEFDGGLISMQELDAQLKTNYSELYKGYIVYVAKHTEWQDELISFLQTVA